MIRTAGFGYGRNFNFLGAAAPFQPPGAVKITGKVAKKRWYRTMSFFELNGKMINIDAVKSYTSSSEDFEQEQFNPEIADIQRVTRTKAKRTVLQIEFMDGTKQTLRGSEADRVLTILRS